MRGCPHCGEKTSVRIVYGLPHGELMVRAERGEILLGGCIISPDQPTRACTTCRSEWAVGRDRSTSAMSDVFAARFANWDIRLPPGAEAAACRGTIHKAGWTIRYRFGADDGGRHLEFYAIHRMTRDSRMRIYESGQVEHLETIQQMVMWDPKVEGSEAEARRRYEERNRRVADELRELGLYPEWDINTYLRTHDVP